MSNETKNTDPKSEVLSLISKSADTHDSNDAMRFAQAALNGAHALITLQSVNPTPTK